MCGQIEIDAWLDAVDRNSMNGSAGTARDLAIGTLPGIVIDRYHIYLA